jgi:hypothetical protein
MGNLRRKKQRPQTPAARRMIRAARLGFVAAASFLVWLDLDRRRPSLWLTLADLTRLRAGISVSRNAKRFPPDFRTLTRSLKRRGPRRRSSLATNPYFAIDQRAIF